MPGPVAIVLPPKEGFSPGAVGAVGLLVHRLVRAGASGVVVGRPVGAEAFEGIDYRPVRPGLGLTCAARYAAGAVRALRPLAPALVEVHNRPEIALALVQRLPGVPVALFLHNDPQGMRRARSPAERAGLIGRVARVVCVSEWVRRRLLDGVAAPARAPPRSTS